MNKGIVLAGGAGTRLRPLTKAVSKQLLPIYDKPMIFYPISVLMLSQIREILIITDPISLPIYKRLLGSGEQLGMNFNYIEQMQPRGLPEAFILGERFINNQRHALVLGDNFFHGQGLSEILLEAKKSGDNFIFVRPSNNPKDFGVCQFNDSGNFVSIVEKPVTPPSNLVATGLYFFDGSAPEIAKTLQPSRRGELEISDMINIYAARDKIKLKQLGRGCAWLDTGTFEGLHNAATYVRTLQDQEGYMIGCLEEIAYRNQWISKEKFIEVATEYCGNYRDYLERLIQ
jgi:glucose-1-phosphate thymidylyltransferase